MAVAQAELIPRLKVAIDRAPRNSTMLALLFELLDENPTSAWSIHVQHNLGPTRRGELVRLVLARGEPRHVDAMDARRSLAREHQRNERIHVIYAGHHLCDFVRLNLADWRS